MTTISEDELAAIAIALAEQPAAPAQAEQPSTWHRTLRAEALEPFER